MIASNRGWEGEGGRYGCTQDRKPRDRECGLSNRERHAAGDNADERRTEDAGAAMKCRHPGADGDKKNGKAYTASVKISQQNKPMPTVLRTSPRAIMVVAPYAKE